MAMPIARSGLLRANLTVASGTALSRLTGLIRIIVFGIAIGQTALADAYDVANNAPNVIYELLLGGILSATLVPMFTRFLQEDDLESTNAIISFAMVSLGVITVVAIVLAPAIFNVFALRPADAIDAELFRQAGTILTRLLLLQIFFYGVTSLCTSILHARRQFFAAAWTPVLANLVTIASLLFVTRVSTVDPPTLNEVVDNKSLQWLLGLGSTSGIFVMALGMLIAVRRADIKLTLKLNLSHRAVKQLLKLSSWAIGYIAANQIALVVIKNLARPGSGNVDAYSKAYAFFSLPHGLLAVSIATTFVPELARAVAQNNPQEFNKRFFSGLKFTALVTAPASLVLVFFAKPIVQTLLQYGNFDADATANTSRALVGLAVGLCGFSIYLFTLRGFYSHGDTRTPFFINLFENFLNILFAVILVKKFDVLGLGLAFSFAYLISSVVAVVALRRKTMAPATTSNQSIN